MSSLATAWAWAQPIEHTATKIVLLSLVEHANEDNECFPSIRRLMQMTSLKETSVHNAIMTLQATGYIKKTVRTRENGSHSSNLYTVQVGQVIFTLPGHFALPETVEGVGFATRTPPGSLSGPPEPLTNEPLYKGEALELYELYPRKQKKPEALRAITKALKKRSFDDLKASLLHYKEFVSATAKEEQYIPYPASWFNQDRWNDTPPREKWVVQRRLDFGPSKAALDALRDKVRNSPAFFDGPYYTTCATDLDKMQLKTWKEELLKLNPNEDFDLLRK